MDPSKVEDSNADGQKREGQTDAPAPTSEESSTNTTRRRLFESLRQEIITLQSRREGLSRKWTEDSNAISTEELDLDEEVDAITAKLLGHTSGDGASDTNKSDFWASIERFLDSDESRLYTRLLEMRQKLEYEIQLLNTWIKERDNSRRLERMEEISNGVRKMIENKSNDEETDGDDDDDDDDDDEEEESGDEDDNDEDVNKPDAATSDKDDAAEVEDEEGVTQHDQPWIVIYRVFCTTGLYSSNWRHSEHEGVHYYLDQPRLRYNKNKTKYGDYYRYSWSLLYNGLKPQGLKPIADIDAFLKKYPKIGIVFYQDYHCEKLTDPVINAGIGSKEYRRLSDMVLSEEGLPVKGPVCTEIVLTSVEMQNAVKQLHASLPEMVHPSWFFDNKMTEPYLPLYHYRSTVASSIDTVLAEEQRELAKTFLAFVDAHLKPSFDTADKLFAEGKATKEHWAKLFPPETIVVTMDGDQPLGYMITILPKLDLPQFKQPDGTAAAMAYTTGSTSKRTFHEGSPDKITLQMASWVYDGQFRLEPQTVTVEWSADKSEMAIADLDFFPIEYASSEIHDTLKRRGETFWMCRGTAYVSYNIMDRRLGSGNAKPRFMIDYDTYRELHPDAPVFTGTSRDDIGAEALAEDAPPGRGLDLLFPAEIDGFAIQDKKWRKLLVEHIESITWNTSAFQRLVLADESKELIEALVDVHMSTTRSADMLEGKGNGLLILLHGPPGTGKTLTAESVAERVKRPLYRVTCGDIGTDAEGVEAYLESVLYIGKIWGCVVLLDEADVFLEERSLADLQRNALVSVFLRVLEYYDGILILTSNRVGMFDEAFRSRIKLALHYSALTKSERRKVWRNFFLTLQDSQSQDVDYDDLNDHLDELAEIKLNGREIRNAISTASELAIFRKTSLRFTHIQHVIRIGGEFEKYLTKTRGVTADEWAVERGVRSD